MKVTADTNRMKNDYLIRFIDSGDDRKLRSRVNEMLDSMTKTMTLKVKSRIISEFFASKSSLNK